MNIKQEVIHSGELVFGRGPRKIATLLGSCVATVLWHPQSGYGGMCHFVLPTQPTNEPDNAPARYCDKAMALFAQLAEERNLKLSQFDGRIFGGGQLTAGERMRSVLGEEQLRPVGQKNATAAFQALLAYGVNIKEADVGEFGYRKVRLNLLNGECEVQFEAC
ncbi:chemotaxis protein CheD [Idiomarina baltica]|uniref:chemotaxis protein CheD n=1 Tax=Idiomarina baltica TaxID=190892 RepID=UPI002356CF5E|nr:chemotaxis protein CheD [Idiomarina baltica]